MLTSAAERPRILRDIEDQDASLARVLQHQCGSGRKALAAAAALVRESSRIVIAGLGASLNAAVPLKYLLCAGGLDVQVAEAGELLHSHSGAHRVATFVIVSRSGESVEIVKLLEKLRGRSRVIAVTNSPDSRLALQADVVLDIHSLSDEFVAIQTYSGTLAVLHLLGMAALDRLEAAQRELQDILEPLSAFIKAAAAALPEWDGFLKPESIVYCLGRGASCGSAQQGALLMGEVAKAPAVGMAVASFRHGPIEVVNRDFRALIFAPASATRPLNVRLASDLLRFGAGVRLIGPAPEEPATLPWITTPGCPELLAPLFEAVTLQVAAVRLAQLRGVVLGSFRYAPQVAVDESSFG